MYIHVYMYMYICICRYVYVDMYICIYANLVQLLVYTYSVCKPCPVVRVYMHDV